MAFSKEVVKMLFDQNGQTLLADGGGKKGTLIFTGTLGAMRTNANFAAYGASRSGARSLAQALAKEYSPSKCNFVPSLSRCVQCTKSQDIFKMVSFITCTILSSINKIKEKMLSLEQSGGIHVVHTIANGGIKDEDGEAQQQGKVMKAESVG